MGKYILAVVIIAIGDSCKLGYNDTFVSGNDQLSKQPSTIVLEGLGKRIDSLLRNEIEFGFSGSVFVSSGDTVLLQNGYGWTDSTKTTEITPITRFYLASTTKGVTGTIALLASEQGLLSMNDTLGKFFPNAPTEHSYITIHDMLIHSSGLTNEYETFGHTDLESNISLIFNKTPIKDSKFRYTGAGYWMAAATIEKASQRRYEHYVQKELFGKAKMKNTSFWFDIDDTNETLVAQKLMEFPPNGIEPNWGFRASSGILTNIVDLSSFFKALIEGDLIRRNTLPQLFGPHKTLSSGIGIGYGWYTTTTDRGTTEIWSRGGEEFGHNSAIRWFKDEKVIIAILTNCGAMEGEDREANRTISDKIEKIIF